MVLFEEKRQSLIDACFPPEKDTLVDALRLLDINTRNRRIYAQNRTTSLADFCEEHVMQHADRPAQEIDIAVHASWPWHETGETDLLLRTPQKMIVTMDEWRNHFSDALENTLRQSTSAFMINDPHSPRLPALDRLHLSSALSEDIGSWRATGSTLPHGYVALLQHTGVSTQDNVRIHGATFGCCPNGFLRQLYCLMHLGLYTTDTKSSSTREKQASRILFRILLEQDFILQSSIRLGILMDCEGRFKENSMETCKRYGFCEETTRVFPDTEAICQKPLSHPAFCALSATDSTGNTEQDEVEITVEE